MKIIKFFFFSLLALSLIAGTGIFLLFQTLDTDQYLPQITKKASLALGRPVSIGHLELGLSSRGITLDAVPVTIADDPGFTAEPFIKVDRVRISLDVKSLLFLHEIHIKHLLLQSPEIHFIRSMQGAVNIRSFGQRDQPAGAPKPNGGIIVDASSNVTASVPPTSGVDTKPPKEIGIKSIIIQDASISYIDQSQNMPLDIWLTGINASFSDLSLSTPFPVSLTACFYTNTPNVQVSALMSLDASKQSIRVTDLKFLADLAGLDIDRLKDISPEMTDGQFFKNITGTVRFNMASLGIGPSGTVQASGDISITDGVIKHFNIIKTLFSNLLGTFGMQGNVDSLFNGQLKDKLDAEDTVIEKAQAQFSFHDKVLFIDDSLVQTNIFDFTAKGKIDQPGNVDMQTILHLNSDVSAALVDQFNGFKYMEDDTKRLTIAASLSGRIPHLKYKPDKDSRKKSRRALIEEGGNILGVLIGAGQTSQQGQSPDAPDPGKKNKKNFKSLLKDFL